MKVLWLCNIMLPAIAETFGLPYSNREGWLTGIYEKLCKENKEIELGICFPMTEIPEMIKERCQTGVGFELAETGTQCYPFTENLAMPEVYDASLEDSFKGILEDFKPDMVHIFGTEFPHTLAMIRAYGKPEQTLVGIQGLCYACADAYMADLPARVINRRTFRDILEKTVLWSNSRNSGCVGNGRRKLCWVSDILQAGQSLIREKRQQSMSKHSIIS